jgi:hypothetical protein
MRAPSRRQFLGTSVAAAAAARLAAPQRARAADVPPATTSAAASHAPPAVQRWPEYRLLFFDLKELAKVRGLKRVLVEGQKDPANPVLPLGGEKEWDHAQAYNYGLVLYDKTAKKYRNWYVGTDGRSWRGTGRITWRTGYAESADGYRWNKPKLGLFEYEGSKDNNIVWPNHVNAILVDDEEPDTGRRYKMATWDGSGLSMGYSRDGIRWTLAPRQAWGWPQSKAPSDPEQKMTLEARCFLRDPYEADPERRFKMYGQVTYGGSYAWPGVRMFGMAYSADGETWHKDPNNPLMSPADGSEDEIHIADVWLYEGWYVCLYEYAWFHPVTGFFTCDIRLAVSRDGVHFERIQNDVPLVPLGHPGAWDSGMVMTSNAPILTDDEILFFYSANDDKYDYFNRRGESESAARDPRRTGRVKWRRDGLTFLRVSPPHANHGEFVTHPVAVKDLGGKRLLINAEHLEDHGHGVRAELQTADGKALSGFALADCLPLTASGTSQPMTWKGGGGGSDLSAVANGHIRLKVELRGRNARLYSVRLA